MTPEEKKAVINTYRKENNQSLMGSLKLSIILILIGAGYFYLIDFVFHVKSKLAVAPGAILLLSGLFLLKGVLNNWNKTPEFEDETISDTPKDK